MINVSELMNDPDFAAKYIVLRTQGQWYKGRFVLGTPRRLQYFGPVQPATEKELEQIPEGDRVRGVMKFMCASPKRLYITGNLSEESAESGVTVSDQIIYMDDIYKIIKVKDWRANGYTRAFGCLIGVVSGNG